MATWTQGFRPGLLSFALRAPREHAACGLPLCGAANPGCGRLSAGAGCVPL